MVFHWLMIHHQSRDWNHNSPRFEFLWLDNIPQMVIQYVFLFCKILQWYILPEKIFNKTWRSSQRLGYPRVIQTSTKPSSNFALGQANIPFPQKRLLPFLVNNHFHWFLHPNSIWLFPFSILSSNLIVP